MLNCWSSFVLLLRKGFSVIDGDMLPSVNLYQSVICLKIRCSFPSKDAYVTEFSDHVSIDVGNKANSLDSLTRCEGGK